ESAWSKSDLAAGVFRHLLHDSVTMQIAIGERQQNMKHGRTQRQQFFRIEFLLSHMNFFEAVSLHDISTVDIVGWAVWFVNVIFLLIRPVERSSIRVTQTQGFANSLSLNRRTLFSNLEVSHGQNSSTPANSTLCDFTNHCFATWINGRIRYRNVKTTFLGKSAGWPALSDQCNVRYSCRRVAADYCWRESHSGSFSTECFSKDY